MSRRYSNLPLNNLTDSQLRTISNRIACRWSEICSYMNIDSYEIENSISIQSTACNLSHHMLNCAVNKKKTIGDLYYALNEGSMNAVISQIEEMDVIMIDKNINVSVNIYEQKQELNMGVSTEHPLKKSKTNWKDMDIKTFLYELPNTLQKSEKHILGRNRIELEDFFDNNMNRIAFCKILTAHNCPCPEDDNTIYYKDDGESFLKEIDLNTAKFLSLIEEINQKTITKVVKQLNAMLDDKTESKINERLDSLLSMEGLTTHLGPKLDKWKMTDTSKNKIFQALKACDITAIEHLEFIEDDHIRKDLLNHINNLELSALMRAIKK